MSTVKLPQLIKQLMFMTVGIHDTPFSQKGTSLCDVPVTLKRQEQFFFFSYAGYIFLQENVCLTLLIKKRTRNYTAALTKYSIH